MHNSEFVRTNRFLIESPFPASLVEQIIWNKENKEIQIFLYEDIDGITRSLVENPILYIEEIKLNILHENSKTASSFIFSNLNLNQEFNYIEYFNYKDANIKILTLSYFYDSKVWINNK